MVSSDALSAGAFQGLSQGIGEATQQLGLFTAAQDAARAAAEEGNVSIGLILAAQAEQMLKSLAMQAAPKALWELAEGLASLALGPIGGVSAGAHFAAAATFGGIAGVSIAADSALSAGVGGAAPHGSPPNAATRPESPGQRSGAFGGRSGSGDRSPSIVISTGGVLLSEADTARAVGNALKAWESRR